MSLYTAERYSTGKLGTYIYLGDEVTRCLMRTFMFKSLQRQRLTTLVFSDQPPPHPHLMLSLAHELWKTKVSPFLNSADKRTLNFQFCLCICDGFAYIYLTQKTIKLKEQLGVRHVLRRLHHMRPVRSSWMCDETETKAEHQGPACAALSLRQLLAVGISGCPVNKT